MEIAPYQYIQILLFSRNLSFYFMIKWYHNLLNGSTTDESLGDFHSYTILNNASMNFFIHIFLCNFMSIPIYFQFFMCPLGPIDGKKFCNVYEGVIKTYLEQCISKANILYRKKKMYTYSGHKVLRQIFCDICVSSL